MDNPLINFIKEQREKLGQNAFKSFHYLTYELNQKIYYYGAHFAVPRERKSSFTENLKLWSQERLLFIYYFIFSFKKVKDDRKVIISSAYFGIENLKEFKKNQVIKCPWVLDRKPYYADLNLFRLVQQIKTIFRTADFNYLLSYDFELITQEYIDSFRNYVKSRNVCALFIPHEIGYFEKIAMDIFNENGLPVFDIIHGFPAYLKKPSYNQSDYLCVWGEGIRKNFIKEGIPSEKIIVTGHPVYRNNFKGNLRNSLDDILVLSRNFSGAQYDDDYLLQDRGKCIFYLRALQEVLMNLEIKSVRLRLHPSENPVWFLKFLDAEFFKIDNLNLAASLNKATLVIANSTTVFFEALQSGVNALVFELKDATGSFLDPINLVPPFDGTDPMVPVATTMEELKELILQKAVTNPKVLDTYIDNSKSFASIAELIENWKKPK